MEFVRGQGKIPTALYTFWAFTKTSFLKLQLKFCVRQRTRKNSNSIIHILGLYKNQFSEATTKILFLRSLAQND
jgi:hypothetical protein